MLITQKQDEINFYAFVSQYEYFKDQSMAKIELLSDKIRDIEHYIPTILALLKNYKGAYSVYYADIFGKYDEAKKIYSNDRNLLFVAHIAYQNGFYSNVKECYEKVKDKEIKMQIWDMVKRII